ncbi:MAG: hypothetical protein WCI57_00300 [Candidatus Berkelbacteria bacterium]
MLTETLFQILLIVGIVAGVLFIIVFCRFYDVLADIKSVTKVVSKRVNEIDAQIAEIQIMVRNCIDVVKGFAASFDFIKTIKNKLSGFATRRSEGKEGVEDED